jgi:hypothetical protein
MVKIFKTETYRRYFIQRTKEYHPKGKRGEDPRQSCRIFQHLDVWQKREKVKEKDLRGSRQKES